ncbi:MAG: helix-turn-helix domain-containing protein [Actinomycetota bacterium]|nr:helix-turn-helix domain-containing protein [Actinomycetota bacterium]
MPSDAPSLGAALRAARERAGQSVEQVSAATRIRATLIRDLEADQFGSSMGSVYARGHVKSIAAALGTDPAPLLGLFDQVQKPDTPPTIVEVASATTPKGFDGSAFAASAASLRPERRTPRWGAALAAAGAVLLVFMAIGFATDGKKAPQTALPDVTSSPSPTAVVRTPAPNSLASKPAVTGAQLRLRLIGGASWVSVSNASRTLFEGILKDGQFKDFNDPTRLKVVVGNALPVNLNCGGKDSGPAGASGQVKRFMCTATGLTVL